MNSVYPVYVLECWGTYRAPPGMTPRYTEHLHKANTYPSWEAAAAAAGDTDSIVGHSAGSLWSCAGDQAIAYGPDTAGEGPDPMNFLWAGCE